ncbi:hypothetical protein JHK87_033899 [Glycine soja]|nr:hypothetical protein JHK87_033899 [Glycine soja]
MSCKDGSRNVIGMDNGKYARYMPEEKQRKESLWLQAVNRKLTAMNKLLMEENDSSLNGKNFKSRMNAEHIDLLHSPWLIELGAFYLNSSGLDNCELDGVYGFFSCDLRITKAVMTLVLPDSINLEYDLTCAICLDFVFNPYALSCGPIFCKSCACSTASVMIFQGLKSASPESKCPICKEVFFCTQH